MKKKRRFVTSREAAAMLKMKNEGKSMEAIVKATGRTWKTVRRALSPDFKAKVIEPIPAAPSFSPPVAKREPYSNKLAYDWRDAVAYEVMGGLFGRKSAEDALKTIGEIITKDRM